MADNKTAIPVYLEIGKKKVFAGALDWPGWCRSGRNEEAALEALLASGPRYARALAAAGIQFHSPADKGAFEVVERVAGSAGTDFGAPNVPPAVDKLPVEAAELERLEALLGACWQALQAAAKLAQDKDLRRGPRGGGRDLEKMLRHVLDSEATYHARLGGKKDSDKMDELFVEMKRAQQAAIETLRTAASSNSPAIGPRGGVGWTARTYVRRSAWHLLDHAWEIEDRAG